MPSALDPQKAKGLVHIVETLGNAASFRNIMKEAARAHLFKDNKTLRRYLDLLVSGRVLLMRTRDVGSVNLQQLYTVSSTEPKIWVGLDALRRHGLNLEISEAELHPTSTDFLGLSRSRVIDGRLLGSLEDCLIHELRRDVSAGTGGISLVIAMIATRTVDLPYLLQRADEMRMGKTVRLVFNRILRVVSSKETDVAAPVFMAVREQFLKIARRYSQTGFWSLVDEKGVGGVGLQVVDGLTDYEIIMSAGKQLGVTG